ncbi:MAG: FecCD family ABC transporter permease [Lepagella sp.]
MKKKGIIIIILGIATVLLLLANLFWGAISIPMADVISALTGGECDEALRYIILESRLPQALTALIAGAALSASGLMLQTIFRNPLAGPSILGITSGASLGVALVLLLFGGWIGIAGSDFGGNIAIMIGALLGSSIIMALLILLSLRVKNNLILLIAGMMTGYFANSVVTLLSSLSTEQGIQSYVMWGMGNFSSVSLERLPWFVAISLVGLVIAMLLAKPLNLLLLGDNYAKNLGVNVLRVRNWLLVATGLLASIVTACCGPIGFVGLAMPHIARLLTRTDNHLVLMPATMLSGSILTLLCNLVSVMPEGQIIPINALTPIAGVPVVLYVILKKRRSA